MKKQMKMVIASAGLVAMLGVGASAQLGGLLKGGGIALIVSQFGGEINKAINRLTKTPDKTATYATKVVPLISVGKGTEVGAAQIMGPPEAVERVKVVAQIEGDIRQVGVRLRALIPVASKNFTEIKRVPGVGVSGLIDVKL